MKFFHLSDLHIGLRLLGRDLSEDQEHILRQVAALASERKPDAVVVAGDLYDRAVPSAEAALLFDRFLSELLAAVPDAELMFISGNHDSAPRVNAYRGILEKQRVHMIGLPPMLPEEQVEKVTLRDAFGPVCFYLLPFVRPSMVKQITGTDENGNNLSYDESLRRLLAREAIDRSVRNVLVSHQFYVPTGEDPEQVERADSEILTVGNIDAVRTDVLEPFDYAALGHIHKPMRLGNEVYRYCGTPLACSVSEAGQQKAVLEVELKEKGDVSVTRLPLQPLREVRVLKGTLEELLKQGSDDYVSAVLTDRGDLDAADMQDRLHAAFPNLLEIRRETLRTADYGAKGAGEPGMSAFELCLAFLKDVTEEEKDLLSDVLNSLEEQS